MYRRRLIANTAMSASAGTPVPAATPINNVLFLSNQPGPKPVLMIHNLQADYARDDA